MMMASSVAYISLIIYLILCVMGIYSFILFVKLATRGIKALDIYIEEKTNNTVS
ncbi:hypothetical protein BD780_001097 [Clostridium tetanomorphum]|uniref:Uncharacterized protein n=1 Tax=Clostridium tetanomorphum TaxID=1553 RepID=A0A923ECW4_CLOTT|nr:hypothetical protein [Clostridium tetanomorphum]KAJ52460.1 hypothetical protein CTM_08196 [Clostridium tetanomorphum DSM 665]MBC2399606.1 hypothetical protein [Clostridium tetanomorphum]MBP1866516.1 hypothetical protein [Clostridium tetanomorphum]NRS83872.1 hypothetical protein [Clostridium tetanomorphum]NRZ97095.1 hypothetical protein [Clostridium tetanomorphum]